MSEADLVKLGFRYLVEDRDRHGNVRLYVRVPGNRKVRIKGTPGTTEFSAAYDAALQARPIRGAPAGSFKALCEAYFASATYAGLDVSTRKWRRRALERICAKEGAKPVALMMTRHVRRMRDELAATPGAANARLKALKAVFAWAIEEDRLDRNPARDVKLIGYATDGHHTWTIEEVKTFEVRHAIGTKPRLAMALMLYTGGRREDAVRLGPQHVRNNRVRFTQAKNEHRKPVRVDIPLHPELAAAIEGTKVGHLAFLVTAFGRPFTANGFGNWFRERCEEAGVPGRAHGLRKAIATRLAEHGATGREIMAVTGHQTMEEVEVYTRAAEQTKLADRALAKLQCG